MTKSVLVARMPPRLNIRYNSEKKKFNPRGTIRKAKNPTKVKKDAKLTR